jgi:hypothetical protein
MKGGVQKGSCLSYADTTDEFYPAPFALRIEPCKLSASIATTSADRTMAGEFRGWTRPRPVRIAFLVSETEHSPHILDGIFADCYGRWGGRFSLVVPCQDNRIVPSYWPWLEKYGPDIVYSYVELSEIGILELHERLAPSERKFHGVRHMPPRLDVFGFKPSYDFTPLSSLASIFRLARSSIMGRKGAPVKIIDGWHGELPSRLLTDNFGTYYYSRGNTFFPHDAQVAASLMTIVAPELRENNLDDICSH